MNIREIYQKYVPSGIRNVLWKIGWHIRIFFRFFPQHMETSINCLFHSRDRFENQLIITTTLRNEAGYIREWIEYHKLVGVDKFIIYDNESTDNLKEVLHPYINSGEVVYTFYPGDIRKIQVKLMNETIRKYRNKTQWIALIDVDEFIVPVNHASIPDALKEIAQDLGRKIYALAINWVMFGYSGHQTKQEGLVMENYTKHAGVDAHFKCIINPRKVSHAFIHYAICLFGMPTITERGISVRDGKLQNLCDAGIEKIRINHYYTRSYEEHIPKIKKYLRRLNIPEDEMQIPVFNPEFLSHH